MFFPILHSCLELISSVSNLLCPGLHLYSGLNSSGPIFLLSWTPFLSRTHFFVSIIVCPGFYYCPRLNSSGPIIILFCIPFRYRPRFCWSCLCFVLDLMYLILTLFCPNSLVLFFTYLTQSSKVPTIFCPRFQSLAQCVFLSYNPSTPPLHILAIH